ISTYSPRNRWDAPPPAIPNFSVPPPSVPPPSLVMPNLYVPNAVPAMIPLIPNTSIPPPNVPPTNLPPPGWPPRLSVELMNGFLLFCSKKRPITEIVTHALYEGQNEKSGNTN
ncbi:hypothetical protein ANCDUO_27741, partial [Ancylostoma duodenale]